MLLSCSKTGSGSLVPLLENELENSQLGIQSCLRPWIPAASRLLRSFQLMPWAVHTPRAGTIFMSEFTTFSSIIHTGQLGASCFVLSFSCCFLLPASRQELCPHAFFIRSSSLLPAVKKGSFLLL